MFEEFGHLSWNSFVRNTQAVLKIYKWIGNPASMATDIAKALGRKYQDPKLIARALTNQGSFYFPLSELTGVAAGGGLRK